MSCPEPPAPEQALGDLDPADALRQTYLHHFDPSFQAALLHLLRLFEGLRFFEHPRQPGHPDQAVREAYRACLVDLHHLAGTLSHLAAEHQDDELTAAGLALIAAASDHGGRLCEIADQLEAVLHENG